MTMKLIIGNMKYSSWSLRPWLAMKVKKIEFEEQLSSFDMSNNSQQFYDFSPSKKVPVLKHNALTVWDSMGILEYLAEIYPEKKLWPEDQTQRAVARSIANEMHGGFPAIRTECPMNMARTPSSIDLSELCRWELSRLNAMWETALNENGGPFLFGDFTIADAMYAPMVSRIRTYKLGNNNAMVTYAQSIENLPAYQEWMNKGIAETWVVEEVEI